MTNEKYGVFQHLHYVTVKHKRTDNIERINIGGYYVKYVSGKEQEACYIGCYKDCIIQCICKSAFYYVQLRGRLRQYEVIDYE